MINLLSAALASICNVGHSAFTKAASSNSKTSCSLRFNSLKVGAAFIFFLAMSIYNLKFHLPTMLFASGYGVALFFSTLFGYMALMNGSMALTSLIISYSVIIPCCFGMIFLNESVSLIQIIGFILLLSSMYLLKQQADNIKTNRYWFIYVAITFLCNGICSVIQKLHQTVYPSNYCNEFMVFSIFVTFTLFLIASICKKEEKSIGSVKYAIPAGILMGLGNYLTLMLSSAVNATVLFPLISVFSMLFNVTVSKLIFKDKFSIIQLIGIGIGVISVLLIK